MIKVRDKLGAVLINPDHIVRVSMANNGSGMSVIDVVGQKYSTWCNESVAQIEQMFLNKKGT